MTKQYSKDFMQRRQAAIESFKQANYDPYTIFINLQALHLDTVGDASDVIEYLKEKEKEIKARKIKSLGFNKKRTNA